MKGHRESLKKNNEELQKQFKEKEDETRKQFNNELHTKNVEGKRG